MGISKGPGRIRQESPKSPNLATPLRTRLFNYDVNDATLKNEHRDWLTENVVPVLTACRRTKVQLTGTASRTGSDQHNLKLSEQRAKVIESFLQQKGIFHDQIFFRGLGEQPAKAAGKLNDTETDEDRAVIVEINPPMGPALPEFNRIHPNHDEDGFDPFVSPRFLLIPNFGDRHTLVLTNGSSLKLRSTNPLAVRMVDPKTNLPVDELIVCGDPARITFETLLEGVAFIEAEGVSGGKRTLLEVHSARDRVVTVDFFFVKDSTGRMPVNRSRKFVDDMLAETTKLWRDQANVSFKVGKHQQLDVPRDLGIEITNKETSAGKNFHILSDMIKSPGRVTVFLVWEWNPDDGNADAEVDKIGGKFIIFEDNLVPGSTPGRVLGHEIGHLFTLKHNDEIEDLLMFGGVGLKHGRMRKQDILNGRAGI